MQVTAQGLRHRALLFLRFLLWRGSAKPEMSGAEASRIWSYRGWRWAYLTEQERKRGGEGCSGNPCIREALFLQSAFQHGMLHPDALGHPSAQGGERSTVKVYGSLFFMAQAQKFTQPVSWAPKRAFRSTRSLNNYSYRILVCYLRSEPSLRKKRKMHYQWLRLACVPDHEASLHCHRLQSWN